MSPSNLAGKVNWCIAAALHSPCERLEQCTHNNKFLLCVQGVCLCPEPLKIKQGFKCMLDTRLGGNCSEVDSCFSDFTVCVDGVCVCRIHYNEQNGTCAYVGDSAWKIHLVSLFPFTLMTCTIVFVAMAFCDGLMQKRRNCNSLDLREIIRDVVREEIQTLLPAATSPVSPSIAKIAREEVHQALQPEVLVSATPEPPTLSYAAATR
ncbi:hypothetical protein HPB47_027433 [Ixodes persulcatus]|uniref:Uncharacterized protein n=1 Tax=Ixodes persulcatus TaxID=34615 RepID=A0AC60PXM3_IXOPE|nr:hypothetical protein HPB47_027433 [Ixodes persulcatus]